MQPRTQPQRFWRTLFEAIVGAVFLEHGFLKLDNWPRKIFEPILHAAITDYRYSATRTLAFYRDHRTSTFSGASYLQRRLINYICSERDFFEDQLSDVLCIPTEEHDLLL